LEEFQHAAAQEGFRYELINGKLEVAPAPDLPHDFLQGWLFESLSTYRRERPDIINYVSARARVFVPGRRATTAPEPDVAAYRDFPFHVPVAERRWQQISPILVAEVISPDTADKDLERNRVLYLEVSSVQEYWVFDQREDADSPTLTVFRRRGLRWQRPITVSGGGTYTTRLLPDFTLVLNLRA
jgi:Uma2 family endonuclease